MSTVLTAGLYVIATPIGNLGDIVPRGVEVLQSAKLIFAEDTRHSGKLFQHLGIDTPCVSCHEHNELGRVDTLLKEVAAGNVVALVSDAGTPLISDPGFRLVQAARQAGVFVSAVPGPCAAIVALSISGIPSDRFLFEGFLPSKAGARDKQLQSLTSQKSTLIFYESPRRVVESLQAMSEQLGQSRQVSVSRELTKTFESTFYGTLQQAVEYYQANPDQCRGEFVITVAGDTSVPSHELSEQAEQLADLLQQELPPKAASRIVAEHYQIPKKSVYDYLLSKK